MGLMTEADDYIAKPVESTELVKRVEELLNKD
jgi:DNA-binding response OmpR family regulator